MKDSTVYQYENELGKLPTSVMKFYGFRNPTGRFWPTNSYMHPTISFSLLSLNDVYHWNFKKLANLIEAEPTGMFLNGKF